MQTHNIVPGSVQTMTENILFNFLKLLLLFVICQDFFKGAIIDVVYWRCNASVLFCNVMNEWMSLFRTLAAMKIAE